MAQAAIKQKRVKFRLAMKTLGQDYLDDISGQDIFLGPFNHGRETLLIHIGCKIMGTYCSRMCRQGVRQWLP